MTYIIKEKVWKKEKKEVDFALTSRLEFYKVLQTFVHCVWLRTTTTNEGSITCCLNVIMPLAKEGQMGFHKWVHGQMQL